MNNKYQIFGIQRTGTNFLENIISSNFNKQKKNSQRDCWKHAITDPTGLNKYLPVVVIYKNPYTWVESIAHRNTVDWLKTQTKYPATEDTVDNLKVGPKNLNVTNLAKTYRDFYRNWLYRDDLSLYYVIKYEELLSDKHRDSILVEMANAFEWSKNGKGPWNIPQRGNVSQSRDYNRERESYYVAGKPEKLTPHHIAEINRIVGEDFIRRMGYEVL